MVNALHVDRNDRTWFFYLLQPLRLLTDSGQMSIDEQLALMKQFLSHAEVSEKKASISNKCDSETSVIGSIKNGDSLFDDSQQPYKKCRVLDSLALQLASLLKFNLNLFRNTYEIPVRLVARLYRVLVTTTARYSHTLQTFFEQAEDKDSIFIINPYASFHWVSLHPSTVYSIMSYHIWCLQVSLSSSMIPQPFRNLTPVVSGLTEVPETAFFPDNRLEVNVILNRIGESIQQLTKLLQQLPNLIVARPLPTLFTPTGPGLPPALQSSVFTTTDDKHKELYDAEPLSLAYISASLDFVLGRYEFQQHQFHKAEQYFTSALNAMNEEKLLHVVEVGLTLDLLETYLKACQSFHLGPSPSSLSASLKPVKPDSIELPNDAMVAALSRYISSDHVFSADWNALIDIETSEDALCELMMKQDLNDFGEVEQSVGSIVTRYQLQHACSRRLEPQLHSQLQSNVYQGRGTEGAQHNAKHSSKLQKATVQFHRRLYTKVCIANAISSMLAGSPSDAVRIVDLLFNWSTTTTTTIDPVVGQQFLMNSLARMLNTLTPNAPEADRSAPDSQRKRLVLSQFLSYLVNLTVSESAHSDQARQMVCCRSQKCQDFLRALTTHELIKCLSLPNQALVRSAVTQSTLKKDKPLDSEISAKHCIPDDFSQGLDDPTFRGFGLSPTSWGLGSYFNSLDLNSTDDTPVTDAFSSGKDVDMRNMALPPTSLLPPPPMPSFHATFKQPPHLHWQSTAGSQDSLAGLHSLSDQSRFLLTTNRPLDVVACVTQLRLFSMTPEQILQLNSAWCLCLGRLAKLEIMPPVEAVDDNFLALVYSNPGFLVPLIQLAKGASLIETSAAVNAIPARSLLLAAYACPPPPTNSSTSSPATSSFVLWLKAVIRHELLLADLLEALSSSTLEPSPGGTLKPRQTRAHLIELTRQIKVCLFHATGLSSHAAAMDSKAVDVNWCIALSPRLVNLAVVFLLYIKEDAFLLPHGKSSPANSRTSLPKGALPTARSGSTCAGSVELVRALLRLYRALPTSTKKSPPLTTSTGDCNPSGGESEQVLGEEQAASKPVPGDSRISTDPLKTAINNLWNLLLFRCILPTLYQPVVSSNENGAGGRSRNSNGRCQLHPFTILDLAETLAFAAANQTDPSKLTAVILLLPEKPSGERGSSAPKGATACHLTTLLHELIICLVHIAKHAVVDLAPLLVSSDKKTVVQLADAANHVNAARPTDPRLSSESSATANTADSESQLPRKRRRWDDTALGVPDTTTNYSADPYQAVLLLRDCSLWPKELPSDVQLSSSGICQLLLPLIECTLSTRLSHSDWLLSLFRAEMLLTEGNYRESFIAYLEAFLCDTDGFTKPPSDTIPESVIRRVVCCCQHLGLLTEAVIFCQFQAGGDGGSSSSLIDLAVNLIRNSCDGTLTGPALSATTTPATTTAATTGSASNNVCDMKTPVPQSGQGEASLPATVGAGNTVDLSVTGSDVAGKPSEQLTPRGACGGWLSASPFDHLDDNMVDYLWNIRILEALATLAYCRGALSQHSKFSAQLSLPELNVNNLPEVLHDTASIRSLEFLRHLAVTWIG